MGALSGSGYNPMMSPRPESASSVQSSLSLTTGGNVTVGAGAAGGGTPRSGPGGSGSVGVAASGFPIGLFGGVPIQGSSGSRDGGRPRSSGLASGGKPPKSTQLSLREHLQPSSLWIPFSVTEIEQGVTSATSRVDLQCEESSVVVEQQSGSATAWFHTHGCGTFRVDYDTESWEKILAVYPYFGGQDRLTIATTMFELRLYHVGLLGNDRSDRCLLLLKFIDQMIEKKESHNFIWSYVAPKLVDLVILCRHSPVWFSLQPFLVKSQRHLSETGLLSFFSQRDADMSRSSDLLGSTTATLLKLNSLIGQPSVVEEAGQYFEWILSAISDEFPTPEGREPLTASEFSKVEVNKAETAFESVAMHGSLTQWVNICRLFNLLYPKTLKPPAVIPSNTAILSMAAESQSSTGQQAPGESTTTSEGTTTSAPVQGAETTAPCADGSVGTEGGGFDAVANVTKDVNAILQGIGTPIIPKAAEVAVPKKEIQRLTTAILCGILAREGVDELPTQLSVTSMFRGLGSATSALISNAKLFSSVLEPNVSPTPSKDLLKTLITSSIPRCSNPIIAQQLHVLLENARRKAREEEEARNDADAAENLLNQLKQHGGGRGKQAPSFLEVAELEHTFNAVLNQCKWVDYITDHWSWYLSSGGTEVNSGGGGAAPSGGAGAGGNSGGPTAGATGPSGAAVTPNLLQGVGASQTPAAPPSVGSQGNSPATGHARTDSTVSEGSLMT